MVSRQVSSPSRQRWPAADLFRRKFTGSDAGPRARSSNRSWTTGRSSAGTRTSTLKRPGIPYHQTLREPMARLVGAQPYEVICMNSLTVNLHLMMATFLPSTKSRVQKLDGGSRVSFRYRRDQDADRASRARSQRGVAPGAAALREFTVRTEESSM